RPTRTGGTTTTRRAVGLRATQGIRRQPRPHPSAPGLVACAARCGSFRIPVASLATDSRERPPGLGATGYRWRAEFSQGYGGNGCALQPAIQPAAGCEYVD